MKYFVLLAGALVIWFVGMAQDTTGGKRVKITATFKPVLKEAAKVNFNASPAAVDTSTPRLKYNIPNQNLNFAFQPGTLKPLALQVDTLGAWPTESYVKVGYGSLNTPFGQAALSVGDGKSAGLNLYAKHVSSKGKIDYQDYTHTNFDLAAFLQPGNNMEWNARFGGSQDKFNKYGYQPKTLVFPEDSLAIKYQNWGGRVSFHNINRTELGISYAPEIKVDVFSDQASNSESNTYFNLPLDKTIGESFSASVAILGNLSSYKPDRKESQGNNYFSLAPSLSVKKSNAFLQAGIKPSWDNGKFKMFPNVMAEFNSTDNRFTFQLGWIGHLRNSGFRYVANYNPYIWAPDSVYNTSIEERYAGFKGSVGDHFTYSARAGYNKWNNQPLFTNDSAKGGKSFFVINEPEVKVLNFGGEIGFTIGEKFSLLSNLQFNQYKPKDNDKAWGLLPLEFKTSMRLQVMKDLYVTSDLYAFDGPWFRSYGNGPVKLDGGMDLSAGAEFKIVDNVKLWAQFNNIFNKEYQRWNQYPVYGFNFLGGVVFSFAQNR
jgi:hypothetical protein